MTKGSMSSAKLAALPPWLRILRPQQWVKNSFVFAPLLFSGEFIDAGSLAWALFAFFVFCMASSAGYVVNDLRDADDDRLHPTKSLMRPLASGELSGSTALSILGALAATLLASSFVYPALFFAALTYIALTLSYSFFLKRQPVVDILAIAMGFVIRVYAGAVAIQVPLSDWMFVTTLSLALFLAAIKRRQELKSSGNRARPVLALYSEALIDRFAEMAGTGALVFYSLFVVTNAPGLVLTVPIVLFALFHYWYIVAVKDGGESPTDALLSDWQMIAAVLAWTGLCAWHLWP